MRPARLRSRNGRSRSTSWSGESRRIHWPLSHSRRSRSKTAPLFWTCVELETGDELVEPEDLLLGAGGPAEQRQVVDEGLADEALGRGSRRRDVWLLRLLIFVRSGLRISGRCANCGSSWPSARNSRMCLGVLDRWSSPRMTWVICIAASSTQTVKWYSGVPSARTMTKSPPRASVLISTRPRTRSSKAITPSADAEAERRPATLGLARGALRRASDGRSDRRSGAADARPRPAAGPPRAPRRAVARIGEVAREKSVGGLLVQRQALHLAVRARTARGHPRPRPPDPRPR